MYDSKGKHAILLEAMDSDLAHLIHAQPHVWPTSLEVRQHTTRASTRHLDRHLSPAARDSGQVQGLVCSILSALVHLHDDCHIVHRYVSIGRSVCS